MPQEPSSFRGNQRYEIISRLGEGGFGVVFLVRDCQSNENLALKTLRDLNPEDLYRLKNEFRSLADISHPNLVSLYELHCWEDQWFFTMEYVRGGDFISHVAPRASIPVDERTLPLLVDATAKTGSIAATPMEAIAEAASNAAPTRPQQGDSCGEPRFDPERLGPAMIQLAEGVAALHHAGKLHCDIKPPNVLVTPEGRVVLLDFGLVVDTYDSSEARAIIGTGAYMAPEQVTQKALSPATDWYSVGVMLYEVLTGRQPFEGPLMEVLCSKSMTDPIAARELNPEIPRKLNDLCMRLLSRDPAARPDAAAVVKHFDSHRAKPGAAALVREPSVDNLMPLERAPIFVGREAELAVLTRAYRTALDGTPAAVCVHGLSGIGKTALIERFLRDLPNDKQPVVLKGRCFEHESVPYKGLDSLVDALCHHLVALEPSKTAALLPRDVTSLAVLFPVLRRVDEIRSAPVPKRTLIPDPHEERRRAFRAMRELLSRMTDRWPMILYLEDLQWGDADSAALLWEVLKPPDPPPALLILNYRTHDRHSSPFLRALLDGFSVGDSLPVHQVQLHELSLDEARQLASTQLKTPLSDDARPKLNDRLVDEAQGSPYLLLELVRHFQSSDGQDDRQLSSEISIDAVLRARYRRLPEQARQLLEVVAVAGKPINQQIAVQVVCPIGVSPSLLRDLQVAHLIRTTTVEDEKAIDTYHDRVRQAIIDALTPEAAVRWHLALGLTLERSGKSDAETLMNHFFAAGRQAQAGRYALQAASQAGKTLAFSQAAELYRRALELCKLSDDEHRDLQVALAESLANAGHSAEAAEAFLAATERANAGQCRWLQQKAAGEFLRGGHIKRGIALLDEVLPALDLKWPPTRRRALFSLVRRRIQLRLRGFGFTERKDSDVPAGELNRIDSCNSIATGLMMNDLFRAANLQTQNMLLSLKAGEPYRVARALAHQVSVSAMNGKKSEKRTQMLLETVTDLAQQLDHPHLHGLLHMVTGTAAYCSGRFGQAMECMALAEPFFRQVPGTSWEISNCHAWSTASQVALGQLGALGARLPQLISDAKQRGDVYNVTAFQVAQSQMHWLVIDKPDESAERIEEAMQRWAGLGFQMPHYWELVARGRIDLYQGNPALAAEGVKQRWPALKQSLLLKIHIVKIFTTHIRARCYLGAARSADEELLTAVERDTATLERLRADWLVGYSQLLRAGVACRRQQSELAAALLRDALVNLEQQGLALYVAAGKNALGKLIGGDEGEALVDQARTWMVNEEVRQPDQLFAVVAPGFDD